MSNKTVSKKATETEPTEPEAFTNLTIAMNMAAALFAGDNENFKPTEEHVLGLYERYFTVEKGSERDQVIDELGTSYEKAVELFGPNPSADAVLKIFDFTFTDLLD